MIYSPNIVFMEEKTIADGDVENRYQAIDSSQVDARLNKIEVDSIEIESEPVG